MHLSEIKLPDYLPLSFRNTPIEKMEKLSAELGKNIYIKRDDLTGIELSGNKVRKLEYALKEAVDQGAQMIITCGAVQSNHARATVVACRKLGLDVHLILRGSKPDTMTGNILIDQIMDAKITYVTAAEFTNHLAIMENLRLTYENNGVKAYVIPVGASNGIGNFGYFNAYKEILSQEKELGVTFDAIACTVGSGGTYSGLCLANAFDQYKKKILGYSVGGSSYHFIMQSEAIMNESYDLLKKKGNVIQSRKPYPHLISDDFQGEGYAITCEAHIDFIKWFARLEGIILDPVYTGKCFYGLVQDVKSGKYDDIDDILFIHTGGIFGLEPYARWFTR